jgi:FAD/FMN-containing dehydrogenase
MHAWSGAHSKSGLPSGSEMNRRAFIASASKTGAGFALGGVALLDCARTPRTPPKPAAAMELDERAIRDLASALHGTVVRPSDSEYDVARRIWNARFDRRPALIARCADAADVQRAIEFARAERLTIAVRGGGHSFAGYSVCDGGLVIDLSRMKAIRVDREARMVDAQPGVLSRDLAIATEPAGLALVLGGCSDVGIAGFTLGGGEGSLNAKYGMACDNLISADVVLADGRLVRASARENADLFWGLRGGGGNFGVVTSFRIRAFPLTHMLAGALAYDLSQAAAVMRAYREFAPSAPDDLEAGFTFSGGPKGPVFRLGVQYAGDAASAEPVLTRLRDVAKPTADTIAQMSYHSLKTRPGPPPGFPSISTGAFLRELSDDVIEAFLALGATIPPGADLELNHLHGAVSRVPLAETAFPLRQPGFDCFAAAAWLAPEQRDAVVAWVKRLDDTLRPHARGAYVNALAEDDGGRVKDAYGSQYTRLAALKRKYDPENVFRLNPNVPPRR